MRRIEIESAGPEIDDQVELVIHGKSYIFLVPTLTEIAASTASLPLLSAISEGKAATDAEAQRMLHDPKRMTGLMESVDSLLVLCSVEPALVSKDVKRVPEGAVSLRRFSDADRLAMHRRLTELAGYSAKAAEAIRPTSETEESSPSSTVSGSDTDGDQVSSSAVA